MEVFNPIQGASNRGTADAKEEDVATAAAEAEGEADAHPMHTRTHPDPMRTHTHPEAFPNMSPRSEYPSIIMCPVSTTVATSRQSRGNRQPAEAAAKTQRTQTDTNGLTTGTSDIPTVFISRTDTIQPHAETGRWITRRGSHATTHRRTSMRDTRRQHGECIGTFYRRTFDGVG
jgi:hypothetical protein